MAEWVGDVKLDPHLVEVKRVHSAAVLTSDPALKLAFEAFIGYKYGSALADASSIALNAEAIGQAQQDIESTKTDVALLRGQATTLSSNLAARDVVLTGAGWQACSAFCGENWDSSACSCPTTSRAAETGHECPPGQVMVGYVSPIWKDWYDWSWKKEKDRIKCASLGLSVLSINGR